MITKQLIEGALMEKKQFKSSCSLDDLKWSYFKLRPISVKKSIKFRKMRWDFRDYRLTIAKELSTINTKTINLPQPPGVGSTEAVRIGIASTIRKSFHPAA